MADMPEMIRETVLSPRYAGECPGKAVEQFTEELTLEQWHEDTKEQPRPLSEKCWRKRQ